MITLAKKAANTFNRVMENHSINLQSIPLYFTPGSQCILIGCNDQSQAFARRIFDELFKPASSGTYFLYMPYESFLSTMGVENSALSKPANLRFYSTNKNTSIGEYCPMCIELGLDKDWREDGSGIAGRQTEWMDDLFFRSFADSPHNQPERFWREFAARGTGVRLAIEITTSPGYQDFRFITYEGSPAVAAFVEVREAFQRAGYNLRIDGFPRMPAFGQLAAHSWQQEVRLIAKRYPDGHDCFPFQVGHDEKLECNFIDCSITDLTCPQFQLRLIDAVAGPKAEATRIAEINRIWNQFKDNQTAAKSYSVQGTNNNLTAPPNTSRSVG